jgi:hypothetical protein
LARTSDLCVNPISPLASIRASLAETEQANGTDELRVPKLSEGHPDISVHNALTTALVAAFEDISSGLVTIPT